MLPVPSPLVSFCLQPSDKFWGDSYLPQIKDMLETLCSNRTVSDCEFFINKRDYPHMKVWV